MFTKAIRLAVLPIGLALGFDAGAVSAQVASGEPAVLTLARFEFDGQAAAITQTPALDFERMARFYRAYAACSSTCIAAAVALPGVETIGEREVIAFITDRVTRGTGILLDGRSAQDRAMGHIATSVNVPLALVSPDNPYFGRILAALGAVEAGDGFDFTGALPLVVFDSGPTTNDAAALIEALVEAGYPTDRIAYYRGGMQVWVALGLSFEE